MFNGYEMWKPDVERCTRYRLTNQRGLACGRCMKTCPLNKVISWDGPIRHPNSQLVWSKRILVEALAGADCGKTG